MYEVSIASDKHASHWSKPKYLNEIDHPIEPTKRTKQWKLKLPMYAPQLLCEEGTPVAIEDSTAPVNSTGLYIADFDCKPKEKGTKSAAEYILTEVLQMESVVTAYISAMGKGVHALLSGPYAENKRDHKRIWNQIVPAYFEDLPLPDGYELDHAGQDINRKLFISPNTSSIIYNLDAVKIDRPVLDEDVDYNPPTMKVLKSSAEEVKSILESIPVEYCDNRDTWLTLLMSIKNELNGEGKAVGQAWSKTSKNYGSDSSFAKDWRSLEDNRSDGVTGATLNWYAKKYAPTIYSQWRKRCAKASGIKPNDYGVRVMDEEEWMEIIEQVPDLGRVRRLAVEGRVSPTGALFGMCATVPHLVGWGLRVEGYAGEEHQPIATNLAVFGKSGIGKSKSMKWVRPPYDRDDLLEHCIISSGATSGQTFASTFLDELQLNNRGTKIMEAYAEAVKEARKDNGVPPKKPKLDRHKDEYIYKPNAIMSYDEANIFDQAVEGTKHGAGLLGAVSAGFFGDAHEISQSAATEGAKRILPRTTPIQMSMWVNAQPNTAKSIVTDQTGFSERFLVISVSQSETYVRRKKADPRRVRSKLLKNWKPPSNLKAIPTHFGADMSELDGSVYLVEIPDEVSAFLEDVKSRQDLEGVDEEECKYLDEQIGDPRWCQIEGTHILAIIVRLAASIALYVGETRVERNHLEAALVMATYAQSNKVGYGKFCGVKKYLDGRDGAVTVESHKTHAIAEVRKRAVRGWAIKAAKKFHRGTLKGKQSPEAVLKKGFANDQRIDINSADYTITDILDWAVEEDWLIYMPDGTYMKGPVCP